MKVLPPPVRRGCWQGWLQFSGSDIRPPANVGFLWGWRSSQVHFLVFDAAPESLGKDVTAGAPPIIHTDPDARSHQALRVLRTGEMAALVAVPDHRRGFCQGLLADTMKNGISSV